MLLSLVSLSFATSSLILHPGLSLFFIGSQVTMTAELQAMIDRKDKLGMKRHFHWYNLDFAQWIVQCKAFDGSDLAMLFEAWCEVFPQNINDRYDVS
jgi:hypothetical protein